MTARGTARRLRPGASQKHSEAVPLDLPRIDKDRPVNYGALAG